MTPKNRYDRLNEGADAERDAQVLSDEWIQAPDGSWIRASDKVAKKLFRKGKIKAELAPADEQPILPPEPEPKARPSRKAESARKTEPRKTEPQKTEPRQAEPTRAEPAPEPVVEPPAEPKRRFGFKTAAEKQRQAELKRHEELERERQAEATRLAEDERVRQAEADRFAEAERARRAELDRQAEADRLAEYERKAEVSRKAEREYQIRLEREAEEERERQAEYERKAGLERARAAELEREVELERARVAGLERAIEMERERQAELEREVDLKRARQAELERERRFEPDRHDELDSPYWRDPASAKTAWPQAAPWPKDEPDKTADAEHWRSSDPWPDLKYTPDATEPPLRDPLPWQPARRRLTKIQRVTQAAIATAMVLAALIIGAGLIWLGPESGRLQRPFTTSGEQGESLDVRTFTITVQSARAASAVQSGGSAHDTQGAWVIVRVRVTASGEPARVSYVAVRDRDGRTYLATDRLSQPLLDGKRTFQPGIPMEGEVVFEVPKDKLDGLTALFAAEPDRLNLDALAEVALPALTILPDQNVATLVATEVRP